MILGEDKREEDQKSYVKILTYADVNGQMTMQA